MFMNKMKSESRGMVFSLYKVITSFFAILGAQGIAYLQDYYDEDYQQAAQAVYFIAFALMGAGWISLLIYTLN